MCLRTSAQAPLTAFNFIFKYLSLLDNLIEKKNRKVAIYDFLLRIKPFEKFQYLIEIRNY